MGNGNIVEMKKYQKKEKYLERLFVVFVFGLLLAWSISIPAMGAPDEGMKMDICRYLAENHKLPHGGDPSIRNGIWGISYAFMPNFVLYDKCSFCKNWHLILRLI